MKKKDVKVGESYVFKRYGRTQIVKILRKDPVNPAWFDTDNPEVPRVSHQSLRCTLAEHEEQERQLSDMHEKMRRDYKAEQDRQRGPAIEGMRALIEILVLGGADKLRKGNVMHGFEALDRSLKDQSQLGDDWDPHDAQVMLNVEDVIAIGIGMRKKGELA